VILTGTLQLNVDAAVELPGTGIRLAAPSPGQARYTARNHPVGEYDHEQPVYRSPCGVAQCLALNCANAAHIEYGNYKQLQQMMGSMQRASGRGYSTIAIAICKTALLLRLKAAQVNHRETGFGGICSIASGSDVGYFCVRYYFLWSPPLEARVHYLHCWPGRITDLCHFLRQCRRNGLPLEGCGG
jgi:hypothetical protein